MNQKLNSIQDATRANRMSHKRLAELAGKRELDAHSLGQQSSRRKLAEMVGTTRSRINFFMNKFRKLGFIHYNGGITIHQSLPSILQD